jgi:hypothetical protein
MAAGIFNAPGAQGQTQARADPGDAITPESFDVGGQGAQAAFTAAIAAAGDGAIIARGNYSVSGLELRPYSKLIAEGAKIRRSRGSSPLLSLPGNQAGLQTTEYALIRGAALDGATGGTRNGLGIRVGNHAAFKLEHVSIRGCHTGASFEATQFACILALKAYDNEVGVEVRPSRVEGGGNSLTFYDLHCVGNRVGAVFDNSGNRYPQGAIVLINPQLLANEVCGLAVIGSPAVRTQVSVVGMAPEANASAPRGSVFRRGALAIPRCSMFLHDAIVDIADGPNGEYGSVDPCFILENSDLSFHNCQGYGGPSAILVQADSASTVTISGRYGCIGTCHGVVAFNGTLTADATQGALVGPLPIRLLPDIPNELADPDIAGYSGAVDVAAEAIGNSPQGRAAEVRFSSRAGAADSNAARFRIASRSAGRIAWALEMTASDDCRVRVAYYPNEKPVYVDLGAHRPVRVLYWANGLSAGPRTLVIYPVTPNGPTIRFRRGHALSGSLTDAAFLAAVNALAAGGYNPRTGS